MSRRGITIVVAIILAIVLVNVVVLWIWFPRSPKQSTKTEETPPSAAMAHAPEMPVSSNNATAPNNPASLTAPKTIPSPPPLPAGFVVERQVLSPSGNLRIKYLRDRKAKLRRIVLEDVHRPDASMILSESKQNAWVIISPDDQWIALDERTGPDGGGARLYHRTNPSQVRYDPVDGMHATSNQLQDAVWSAYLDVAQSDPNTLRSGVTIDATGWDSDSRKLAVSVAHVVSAGRTEIPAPWSCTYNVISKQVELPPPAEGVTSSTEQTTTFQDTGQGNEIQQEGAQSDAATSDENEFPGEKFPATREDELTVSDVNESSVSDIVYAINEMYARHGANFKDKKVVKQFSDFSWYQPRLDLSMDQIESEFSDLEKQNLKVLKRCRDAKLAANRQHVVHGERVPEESKTEHFLKGVMQGVSDALTPDQ